jgi:DNA-binding NtrC family response regulator
MAASTQGRLAMVFDWNARQRSSVSAAPAAAGCAVHVSAHLSDLAPDSGRLHPDLIIIAFESMLANAALAESEKLHAVDRRLPIIFVVAGGSEDIAVAALRVGVKDYLREPLDDDALTSTVRRCLESTASRKSALDSRQPLARAPKVFVGNSRPMREVSEYLMHLARSEATVLITGETGTGKELAARLIHNASNRRRGPLVSVNCAAIPETLLESELFGYESGAFTGAAHTREGLLQQANHGTIFLDEVGDLTMQAQPKILRAIEAREIQRVGGRRPDKLDIRIVAATNQDLEIAIEDGRFRKDLYFRLNVTRIHLPSLRERPSDIVPLLDHYLHELNGGRGAKRVELSADAVTALQTYTWPGNVRELRNLVEALLVCPPAGCVGVRDLPEDFRRRLQRVCDLPAAERHCLIEALLTAQWNKSKAAKTLRCSRMTLYRKMAKYSILTSDDARAVSHPPVTPLLRKSAK